MPLSLHEWFTNYYAETKVSQSVGTQFSPSVVVVGMQVPIVHCVGVTRPILAIIDLLRTVGATVCSAVRH